MNLRVVAEVPGAVCMPAHPVQLDALLMAAVALRDQLPPPEVEVIDIPIPVERERGIYLCTQAIYEIEEYDRHWINRRFPIEEAQSIGAPSVKRVQLTAGPTKSYRIPVEVGYLKDARAEWYCVGDADAIRALLTFATHLGKKRSVGKGEIASWTVEECEAWNGFPLMKDGRPLRPLPLDWPGVTDAERAFRVLTPPYWQRWREEECLC